MERNEREIDAALKRSAALRQSILRRIELMYAAELSTLDDVERRQTVLAIDALVDFDSWARMRDFSGLSTEEAREIWIRAIDRLLPPTPPQPRTKRAVS